MSEPLIQPHGGYRKLRSFRTAQLAYDLTVQFVERYLDKRSRTCDQMVQAARSGVQNIAEGSLASGTSRKTELKLTNVARASLEELRLDYEDFLRQRRLNLWGVKDRRVARVRSARPADLAALRAIGAALVSEMSEMSDKSDGSDRSGKSECKAEVAANLALVLICQACALLDRQIERLARNFVDEGGFTERLYRIRSENRK